MLMRRNNKKIPLRRTFGLSFDFFNFFYAKSRVSLRVASLLRFTVRLIPLGRGLSRLGCDSQRVALPRSGARIYDQSAPSSSI